MWLALKWLASGALDGLLRGISAALKWLLADWRNAVVGTVLPGFFWMTLVVAPGLRADLAETSADLNAERAAHIATVENYTVASARAQRRAKANAARVKAEQEAITDATKRLHQVDLAALRARFDRLRARNAATDPRRADPAGLPAAGNAAGRAAPAPGDQDLPATRDLTAQPLCPSQFVCLTLDEAEQASIDAHNHDRLIDWVEAQSAVRFTPEQEPR